MRKKRRKSPEKPATESEISEIKRPIKKRRKKRINIGKLISDYLIHSYIYYESGSQPVISDSEFDNICHELYNNYHLVEKSDHIHKKLVKLDSLSATTGFDLKFPNIVKICAIEVLKENK